MQSVRGAESVPDCPASGCAIDCVERTKGNHLFPIRHSRPEFCLANSLPHFLFGNSSVGAYGIFFVFRLVYNVLFDDFMFLFVSFAFFFFNVSISEVVSGPHWRKRNRVQI